jgi:flagellar biogenesis protein FliO
MRHLILLGTCVVTTMAETVANAQLLGQGAEDGVSVWRVIAALLLCLALGTVGIFALRSRLGLRNGLAALQFGRSAGRLKLIETLRLGPQTSLHLIDIDGNEMLITSSAGVISHLPVTTNPATVGREE